MKYLEKSLEIVDLLINSEKKRRNMSVYTDESLENQIKVLEHDLAYMKLWKKLKDYLKKLPQEQADMVLVDYGTKEIHVYYNFDNRPITSCSDYEDEIDFENMRYLKYLESKMKDAESDNDHEEYVITSAERMEFMKMIAKRNKMKRQAKIKKK